MPPRPSSRFTRYLPPSNSAVALGRGEGCALAVDRPSVSRKPARFHVGPLVTVEDLKSRNGTIVRGTPIVASQHVPVRPGDIVECGDVLLLLQALSVDGPAAKLEAAEAAAAPLGGSITELV